MDVNEIHNHPTPSRPPSSTSSAQTRQKIVEILAGTANGCLSELGYVPGMPQRLKELERQNEEWKFENIKLYQDNASLLDLIHQQNERIEDIRASDPDKNTRIIELSTELQKMRTQRYELARAQSANNSSPSQLQQNFIRLQGDYIKIIIGYRTKCAEVQRLESHVRTLATQLSRCQSQGTQTPIQHCSQHQPQQQSQRKSRPQVQQHPQHQPQQQPQWQSRPPVQQHPQPQQSQQSQSQVQQHQLQQQFQQQNRPQIPQHLQSQPLHQPQPVCVQRPQLNYPAQRQSAPTLLQPHVQQYVQQLPQPVPAISPGQQRNTKSPPVYGQIPKQKYPLSQTQQAILEQRYQTILQSQQPRPRQSSGSMPGISIRPDQEFFVNMTNSQQHSPLLLGGPSSSSRSNSKPPYSTGLRAAQTTSPMILTMPEPLAAQSRTSLSNNSPPTPVVSPHSPLNHSPLNQSSLASPSSVLKTAIPPSNQVSSAPTEPNTLVPLTISPQNTSLNVNQVSSPQGIDVQSFNTNTSSAGTFLPVTSSTASQPVNIALGPPQQVNSLKRDSPNGSENPHTTMEQPQKRPRLEKLQLTQKNTSIEPVTNDTENIEMDIDEDEVVEVGPDGLRLVNDCISDLFGEERERGERRYCKLCIARRTMGYRTESPKPFVNATNDELEEHCITEHAEAWDTLRQTV